MMDGNSLPSSPMVPGIRRSVTLPVNFATSTTNVRHASNPSSPDPSVEILYAHPSVRIVSFTTASKLSRPNSSNGRTANTEKEEAGTLPSTSRLERTIAVGSLRIYRAPGSVAFLSCGSALQPILPKSQCWCVDEGSSKFVLQIRRPQYWRIEMPNTSSEDIERSEEFKEVLAKILLFEKTICPFKRSFTVDLPEVPDTPVKKRPWKPVERPKVVRSLSGATDADSADEYYSAMSDDSTSVVGEDSDSDATDDTNVTPTNKFPRSARPPIAVQEHLKRIETLEMSRSVTSPKLNSLTMPSSSSSRKQSPLRRSITAASDSSSVESFQSIKSWHSSIDPLPPSPPQSNPASPTGILFPHNDISLPKRPIKSKHDPSEIASTDALGIWEMTTDSGNGPLMTLETPQTLALVKEHGEQFDDERIETVTPTARPSLRHRPTTGSNSRRRALSPLPPAANIFSPTRRRPRHLQTARHLPTAILQKTCEILLSPPSHLLHLMLNIASKIAAGQWRGIVFGLDEDGEKIPVQWDTDGDYVGDIFNEDDYGMVLPGSRRASIQPIGNSWEVD